MNLGSNLGLGLALPPIPRVMYADSSNYFGYSLSAPPPPPGGLSTFGAPPPPPAALLPMFGAPPPADMLFGGLGGSVPPPPPPMGAMGTAGGFFGRVPPIPHGMTSRAPPSAAAMNMLFDSAPCASLGENSKSHILPMSRNYQAPLKPVTTVAGLSQLISLQAAEGFWLLNDSLASLSGVSLAELKSLCPVGIGENEWATVIALVLLEKQFNSQRDEWELVAMKAEMWLQAQPLASTLDALKAIASQKIK